ncbi:helix-turn-helix domain-containing protein [Streptomyces sp. NPDC058861]|uniref:helix-turn-helix domain-containing protein n=1 Tax=Streptomyces sp. NPDC058861 TaxID=3346653 RepID=UPI003688CA85
MGVRLSPEGSYRHLMESYFRESGMPLGVLAENMGVSPGMVTSYLRGEILPDPSTFLRLRHLLNVPWTEPRGLDHDYVQLLALAQTKPRRRTSKIQDRHVVPTGAPDPLEAESAEELVEKLREVYGWALRPSYRELEKLSGGHLKRSTIGDMLHADNKVLPRFDRYARFLEACGVKDLTYWVTAWRKWAPPDYSRGHWMAMRMEEDLRAHAQ